MTEASQEESAELIGEGATNASGPTCPAGEVVVATQDSTPAATEGASAVESASAEANSITTNPADTQPVTAVESASNDNSPVEHALASLKSTVQQVLASLERIHSSIDTKLLCDTHQQLIIDRLHAELVEHKAGLAMKILQPLAMDLIMLYDDVGKVLTSIRSRLEQPDIVAKLIGIIDGYQADIEDILERHGFAPFSSESETFDGTVQRVQRRVPTPDSVQHGTIERRLSKGFRYEQRMVRPELVSVFRADTTSAQPPPHEHTGDSHG